MQQLQLALTLLLVVPAAAAAASAFERGGLALLEDPLDTLALEAPGARASASGLNLCDFGNGSRITPLPADFFGPEPCVFAPGMVLRANDTLGGKGAAAGALIWGYAKPGATVTLEASPWWSSVSCNADAQTGRWELTLQQEGSPVPKALVFSTRQSFSNRFVPGWEF